MKSHKWVIPITVFPIIDDVSRHPAKLFLTKRIMVGSYDVYVSPTNASLAVAAPDALVALGPVRMSAIGSLFC